MTKKNSVVKLLQNNIEAIKMYGVARIGVFGSFMRSQQTRRSDIDILVEFQKGKKTFDNYMELKFFLGGLLHRKIDLVVKDAIKDRIKQGVIKETVYARL